MQNNVILIVDDSVDDRVLMRRSWRASGIWNEIVFAADGEQALNFLFGSAPDAPPDPIAATQLIILDLHMPGMGGIECLRRLRADPRTKSLPVAVLTGSTNIEDERQARELGVAEFLRKPTDTTEFIRVTANLGLKWILMREEDPTS